LKVLSVGATPTAHVLVDHARDERPVRAV
jgi:hypothetical protein